MWGDRILSRCVPILPSYWDRRGEERGERQLSDSPATTPLSYLQENLASMSFSRAIIRAVKGPTVAVSSSKRDLSADLTEIREVPGMRWSLESVGGV